ncbi:NirD/YgiW/YdeI family stress tolerance protein [Tychonema sp. LEGE 07199]|uniref:NirD/YgiW/YdeI family stress tolerance protein n=1 Tax=unclassified Tychonema TaxID=2642144 RepID=UPI0018826774|nr:MULTISPECIES: NirD/YgiW/YdeI family stress tolerance protein [unclassified Tychonema]MBE9121577.1 NirD/YgiW/YdeI family stress tolerance protein [Tychonema sp. LEGE 07199]MBE9131552.1 NirD/YgiW/YdeI family stress tolerance protein [Tychonema sp. LEGE 07196]
MKRKKLFSLLAVTTILSSGAATSAFAQSLTRISDLQPSRTPITISGKVVGFGDADDNEWIIDDGSGRIRIDAGPRRWRDINVSKGETIRVVGEMDDDEFNAFSITRSNGSLINIRSPQGREPWDDKNDD